MAETINNKNNGFRVRFGVQRRQRGIIKASTSERLIKRMLIADLADNFFQLW